MSRISEKRINLRLKDLKFIFIEDSTEGYMELQTKFNFTFDNTERLILPTNYFFLKKKLNNIRGTKFIPYEFENFL